MLATQNHVQPALKIKGKVSVQYSDIHCTIDTVTTAVLSLHT